jgi:hypothetical protein
MRVKKDVHGTPWTSNSAYGIRTRDLRLERAASWAARRMRPMYVLFEIRPDMLRGYHTLISSSCQ